MFEARLQQGNVLKKLAEALKELVTQVNFSVNNDGVSVNAMDNSHVCLVHLNLKRDMFQHYRCDRPMQMGVNMGNLVKVLKCAANDDIITLKADDDGDTLTLMFEATTKQDRVSDFELKLLSIDSEDLNIPAQEYTAEIIMPSSEYQRIFKDLATIGETVHIQATKGSVKFSTSGDFGSANVVIRETLNQEKSEDDVVMEVTDPVVLTFALRYLNNFAKATPLSNTVKLQLTRDLPIAVEYTLSDGGALKYYLAPKIDDEEPMEEEESKPMVC